MSAEVEPSPDSTDREGPPRSRRPVLAALVALAFLLGCGFVAWNATAIRIQLLVLQVDPGDVQLGPNGGSFEGVTGELMEAGEEALPVLISLALEEVKQDKAITWRALLIETVRGLHKGGAWPNPPSPTTTAILEIPVDPRVFQALESALKSRHEGLASLAEGFALEVPDRRAIDGLIARIERLQDSPKRSGDRYLVARTALAICVAQNGLLARVGSGPGDVDPDLQVWLGEVYQGGADRPVSEATMEHLRKWRSKLDAAGLSPAPVREAGP